MDFGSRGAAALIEDVHDLAFSATESLVSVFAHIFAMLQKQQYVAKVASTRFRVKGNYSGRTAQEYNET